MKNAVLTQWQEIQAGMLYKFSSTEYLKELHRLVTRLIDGVVDPLLETAKLQGRDSLVASPQWGERDTSQNWANNAWPYLKDLQQHVAGDIAARGFGRYHKTAVNECLRGAEQSSMLWATEEEEDRYRAAVQLINNHASRIDQTLSQREYGGWDDFDLMQTYPAFRAESPSIPAFRVRTDIVAKSGSAPPQTGVYVSADDPHAALQFAWTGPDGCRLQNAISFNEIGLKALKEVGRERLWVDDEEMYRFATRPDIAEEIDESTMESVHEFHDLAASAVAEIAFEARPSSWYFVEIIPGQVKSTVLEWPTARRAEATERVLGGQHCRISGYYYSPARQGSRQYFEAGALMPEFNTDFGTTIWQRDENQE